MRVREDLAKVDLVSVNTLLPEIRDGGKVPDGVLTTRVRNGKRLGRHPRTGARLATQEEVHALALQVVSPTQRARLGQLGAQASAATFNLENVEILSYSTESF